MNSTPESGPTSKTTSSWARCYREHGWSPVPVPFMEKGPIEKGWNDPARTFSAADFPDHTNIGLRLGRISGGLTDIDLDSPEALAAGPVFLPATSMISGRKSKPQSHYWYLISEPPTTIKFEDPVLKRADPGKATLLELRADAKNRT